MRGARQLDLLFYAVSDDTRRRLLALLADGERPVHQLAVRFTMSRPAVSQHLRVLRTAGLVAERKVGRQRLYRLRARPLRSLRDWVAEYERHW